MVLNKISLPATHVTSDVFSSTLRDNGTNIAGSPRLRSTISRSTREDTMKTLDEKIRKLSEAGEGSENLDIILLKRQRNSHAPISQLPVEILTNIFLHFQNHLEHESNDLKCAAVTYEIIQITHVCCQWREVALGYPGLWSIIESGNHTSSAQIQNFLDGSKKIPLDIRHEFCDCVVHHNRSLNNLGLITDQLFRVTGLDILGNIALSWPLIKVALQKPAPVLQACTISSHAASSLRGELFEIDSDLFGGSAPNLRRLMIINIKISFQSLISTAILGGLKVLHLTGYPGNTDIPGLLSFIQNSAQLEDLRLTHFLTEEYGEAEFSRCATVHLPRLRCFFMDADVYTISFLLGKLVVPQDVYWRITCIEYPIMDPNYHEIPAMINTLEPCKEIRIFVHKSRLIIERDFLCSRDFDAPHFVYDFGHIDLETNSISASRVFELLSESVKNKSWSHAEGLRFHIVCDEDFIFEIDHECWIALLESMPKLFFLDIYFFCESDLGHILLQNLLNNVMESNLDADATVYAPTDEVDIVISSGRRFSSLTQVHITQDKLDNKRERRLYFGNDEDEELELFLDCLAEQGFLNVDVHKEDIEEG